MKQRTDYIQSIAEITSRSYRDVKREMVDFKKTSGVTFKEFYQNKLWEKSPAQRYLEGNRIIRKRNLRNRHYEKAAADMGITVREVRQKLKAINDKNICRIIIAIYASYELYRYDENEIDEILHLFARRNELKRLIKEKLTLIDDGELTYQDLDAELKELEDIFERLMPESLYLKYKEKLAPSRPDILENEELLPRVLRDMAMTKFILGFGDAEYVSFNFVGKTLAEKRTFISDSERLKIIETINDPECFDYLDDKFQGYSRLKQYYRREMMLVSSSDDFDSFKEFCLNKNKIVIKPLSDSMGRGIKPIEIQKDVDLAEVFSQLCEEYNHFIVEELIVPHRRIEKLNPDSINTVRVITYFDGKKSIIHDTFMKVGRQGSFVDNGGAGGILVSVNPKTGRFKSDGCDERGVVYKTHPDTGIQFQGYRLPRWRKAKKLALELATKVPGLNYIGWDLTYTNEGEWIIVEGNAKTQFFGQQCTTAKGMRKDFIDTVKERLGEYK